MSDLRRARTPHFLEATHPDAPAMPAAFERLQHPRASPTAVPSPRTPPVPGPASSHAPPPPSPPLPPPMSSPTPPPGALDDGSPRLAGAVENLRLQASRLAEQARADALEIGFQVARRIIELELAASPEPLFALVKSAVRRLGDARRLVIRVHPEDAKLIDAPEGRQRLGLTLLNVEVSADATLGRGDCVVESDNATVDGRVATRLDELKRGVASSLASEEP